jgi:hypothetical protein
VPKTLYTESHLADGFFFTPSCPYADENNAIIMAIRKKYDEKALTWNGSLYGMVQLM